MTTLGKHAVKNRLRLKDFDFSMSEVGEEERADWLIVLAVVLLHVCVVETTPCHCHASKADLNFNCHPSE